MNKGKKEGGMGRVMDHKAEWEERTEEGLGKEGETKSAYRKEGDTKICIRCMILTRLPLVMMIGHCSRDQFDFSNVKSPILRRQHCVPA